MVCERPASGKNVVVSFAMRPSRIDLFPTGEMGIVWEDGHESFYGGKLLRCGCRCAMCVDEITGRKLLDETFVADHVHPLRANPVGNYGVNLVFSDGHSTGIYSHAFLREACPCGDSH